MTAAAPTRHTERRIVPVLHGTAKPLMLLHALFTREGELLAFMGRPDNDEAVHLDADEGEELYEIEVDETNGKRFPDIEDLAREIQAQRRRSAARLVTPEPTRPPATEP